MTEQGSLFPRALSPELSTLARDAFESSLRLADLLHALQARAATAAPEPGIFLSDRTVAGLVDLASQTDDYNLGHYLLTVLAKHGAEIPPESLDAVRARALDDPRLGDGSWSVRALEHLWEELDRPSELATPLALATLRAGGGVFGGNEWSDDVDWSKIPSELRRTAVVSAAAEASLEAYQGFEDEGHRALSAALDQIVPKEFPDLDARWTWVLTKLFTEDVLGGWVPGEVAAEALTRWGWPEAAAARRRILAATRRGTFADMVAQDEWLGAHVEALRQSVAEDRRQTQAGKRL
jgi:hypothetical protein